jgi:hypothetical protein
MYGKIANFFMRFCPPPTLTTIGGAQEHIFLPPAATTIGAYFITRPLSLSVSGIHEMNQM